MEIIVLGAGTCVPASGYSPPGYVLRMRDSITLIDPGPGSLSRMAEYAIDFRQVGYVLVSHLHPDHTLDILTLIQALGAAPGFMRQEDLTFIGCAGLAAFVERLLETYEDIAPETFQIQIKEFGGMAIPFDAATARAAHTLHTPGSLAFRLDSDEGCLVFSGDVADPDRLIDLCHDADTLICECSFPDGEGVSDHLTPGQVGRLAQASAVRHLVLTHLYPPAIREDVVSQARAHYGGPIVKAHDGLVVRI